MPPLRTRSRFTHSPFTVLSKSGRNQMSSACGTQSRSSPGTTVVTIWSMAWAGGGNIERTLRARVPTVNWQDHAGDKSSPRRTEEYRCARDVFRLAPALHRCPFDNGTVALLILEDWPRHLRFNP